MNLNAKTVSLEEGKEAEQSTFCTIWENGKPALALLQVIIRNDVVKWIVGLIIKLGDGLAERLCSPEKEV